MKSFTTIFLRRVFYREPLPEYHNYVCWISKSGFMGRKMTSNNVILKSIALCGTNMVFKRELLAECSLARLYRRSRKGFGLNKYLLTALRRKAMTPMKFEDQRRLLFGTLYMNSRLLEARDFGTNFGYTMIA